jgi:hypothetical protein
MAKANETMGSKAMGKDTMVNDGIKSASRLTQGFTLIATLLMLLLLSGVAIGLMMMVHTESKVGATDLQNDVAYHVAEGGIEKMASDLAAVFQNAQSPTCGQILGVGANTNQPSIAGVNWVDYSVIPQSSGTACTGNTKPKANWGQISSGPNQGLWAQIIPVNMLATAAMTSGQEVSMTRSAQVALIPVFQFGVFCDGDCGFFNSPNLTFVGRVHTNADLYLGVANGSTLIFNNKLEAYGNVITQVLPNGLSTTTYNDTGNVYIPTTPGGCSTTTTNCVQKNTNGDSTYGQGSVTGAGSSTPQTTNYNGTNWNPFSKTSTNLMLINGNYGSTGTTAGTGAKKLSMPFVNGTTSPFELIRRPPTGESTTTALGESREYNLAQIRVLLTDDPAELPGGASDTTNNIRLANVVGSNVFGIPTSVPATMPALPIGSSYVTMFAQAWTYVGDPTSCGGTWCTAAALPQDWPLAPATPPAGAQTLVPAGPPQAPVVVAGGAPAPTLTVCNTATCVAPYYSTTANAANAAAWNLIDGYLRVEYKDVSGNWNPVTMEWLKLGFARGLTPPIAGVPNPVNPNAILLLQQPADRNGDGAIDAAGLAPKCLGWNSGHTICTGGYSYALPPEVWQDNPATSGSPWYGVTTAATATQSITLFNWYPINFYDAREGEPRDVTYTGGLANSCTTNGVMNAVEIDVANLKKWLAGTIGTSGTSVDYVAQNGYVLYFSDRRGMLPNPNGVSSHAINTKSGDSGLEDVINRASAAGTPDGALEAIPAGRAVSPEDVNGNGLLDEWGTANLGLGFWGTVGNNAQNLNTLIVGSTPDDPYGSSTTNNRIKSCSVTARKNWVSGARHVLKLVDGSLGNLPLSPTGGGFTVASENPVYIQGDYNSNAGDTFFTGATSAGPGADVVGHAPAAVIADAATILSNAWSDNASMFGTTTQAAGNRTAATTYYRVAIAGGKNMAFTFPTWETAADYGFGTDGGIHNFLRFLEDWNGQTLNYGGSLVSLFYSTYNTGLFKCCNYAVYRPPTRNYIFDTDFTNPSGLPPGTPMFKDVESLGYRQLFATRTN